MCLLMVAFLVPLPKGNPTLDELFNLSHIVVFAAVAALLMISDRSRTIWQSALLSIGIVMAIGLVIELIQPKFGRRASVQDLIYDFIGGLIGVSIAIVLRFMKN